MSSSQRELLPARAQKLQSFTRLKGWCDKATRRGACQQTELIDGA